MPTPSQSNAPVLCVVIPVYNERDTWRKLLAKVDSAELPGCRRRIIIVDDASSDGTREELEELTRQQRTTRGIDGAGATDLKVLFHDRNRGKGAALRTGFAAADGDFVIVQDADLEYDPADYPRLLEPLLAGRAEVVYGSRFGEARPRGYLRNYLANRFLTCLSNLTTGLKLTDMETCYKAFKRQVLLSVSLEQDRFGFEPEITAKAAALGVRIVEVPISYNARRRQEGKKIGWKDGLKAIWCILKYGLGVRSRRRRHHRH